MYNNINAILDHNRFSHIVRFVMVVLVALCNHCSLTLNRLLGYGTCTRRLYSNKVLCSSHTDDFVENLVFEEGVKQEFNISKYLENVHTQNLLKETLSKISSKKCNINDFQREYDIQDIVSCVEEEINIKIVPNEELKYLLIYFTKDGFINGVKAIQNIVEKYNVVYFKAQAEYNHYLAEAFWINGKMNMSLQLFSFAYDNVVIRPKVKVMLPNLFPSLIAKHSEASLCQFIHEIESFSAQKNDYLILACLWRELFQSTWFSDQEQASKLLLKKNCLLKKIQWMIPSMGKNLLRSHRVDDFYRLIQFTLENELKPMTAILIRLLFDYFYIHQNIERCTAVVKYSSNFNSPLTEEQQRRYVNLLLKSKDAANSKLITKKPQNLQYKF